MIDQDKVKRFWDGRAALLDKVAFESVANLEQDPDNLKRKVDDETAKVFAWLEDVRGLNVLDLGAGVGQWAFRFAERGVNRLVAVEYAEGLAEIGAKEAERRQLPQVEFHVCAAERYTSDEAFDLVYISGLFVYLNDDQASALMANLSRFVKPGGRLLLRDGTGVGARHEIDDRHSEHLNERYSATYRTRNEYVDAFVAQGFELVRDENMFAEGHPLNKYPETRLRLYLFRKPV